MVPSKVAITMTIRPRKTWARSLVFGRKWRMKSRTASVETEFMTDKVEEIREANSAARTKPRTPVGRSSLSRVTNVVTFSAGKKCQSDHARKSKDENRQELQNNREHPAPACLINIAGSEDSLYVYLVHAPIKNARAPG